MMLAKLLAEEHVLIATTTEAFIKRATEHHIAPNKEIGGTEGLIGSLSAFLCSMIGLFSLLIQKPQVIMPSLIIGSDTDTTTDNLCFTIIKVIKVTSEKRSVSKLHIAVNKKQIWIRALLSQEVACGSSTSIHLFYNIYTMGNLRQFTISLNTTTVG